MVDAAPDETNGPRSLGWKLARTEGYLSLVLVVSMFLVPSSPPLTEEFGLMLLVSLWALAWLFAIGGARRGRGGARLAAVLSLEILVLEALFIVVVSVWRS